MKRLNYFQVHKNKKPKKVKAKKTSKLILQSAIIAMQSFVQHSIIASQSFNSLSEKTLSMFENIKIAAEGISNLYKTPIDMK